MPYTRAHKEKTRSRILESAYRLFSVKGFDAVTIDRLMAESNLTRGAFYAHFDSKASVYLESLVYAAAKAAAGASKPPSLSDQAWLALLLDGYLSLDHVRGREPCLLAFLSTDIQTQNADTRATYASVYEGMNKVILKHASEFSTCDEADILAVTAMMVGAVAIARTIEDDDRVIALLRACRQQSGAVLGGI